MIKRLSDLKIGDYATIQMIFGRGRMRTRMFDMGITPGAKIFYRKDAPMGDPIQISIRGYELTLRKREAFHILVETGETNDGSEIDMLNEKLMYMNSRRKGRNGQGNNCHKSITHSSEQKMRYKK